MRATTVSPTTRSVSMLAWKRSPTWFFEESTPSIMRTNRRVPAGTVTFPPADVALSADRASVEVTPLGAPEAAGDAPEAEDLPVKVSATTSLTRNTSTFPFISKRTCAAVPPRYLPFSTRPSFNSSVSAEAGKATTNNATANARLTSIQKRLIISPQGFQNWLGTDHETVRNSPPACS